MKKSDFIFITLIIIGMTAFCNISIGQEKTVYYYKYNNGETATVTKERTGDILNLSYLYSDPEIL
ncbi:hypothetical protein JW824_08635 [bacterium]|nr:hypothetical protein [bacterium]